MISERKLYQSKISKLIRFLEHYHKGDNINLEYLFLIKRLIRKIPLTNSLYKNSILKTNTKNKKILMKYLKGIKIDVGMELH